MNKQQALTELSTLLESVTMPIEWDTNHERNWSDMQDSINQLINYVKDN